MLSEDCDSLEVAPGVWVPVMSNTKAWRALPRLTMLYEASTILALVRGTTDPVIWMASLGPLNTLEDEWRCQREFQQARMPMCMELPSEGKRT